MQYETMITVTMEIILKSFDWSVLPAMKCTNNRSECVNDWNAMRPLNRRGIVWDTLAEVLLSGIG